MVDWFDLNIPLCYSVRHLSMELLEAILLLSPASLPILFISDKSIQRRKARTASYWTDLDHSFIEEAQCLQQMSTTFPVPWEISDSSMNIRSLRPICWIAWFPHLRSIVTQVTAPSCWNSIRQKFTNPKWLSTKRLVYIVTEESFLKSMKTAEGNVFHLQHFPPFCSPPFHLEVHI